MSEKVYDSSLFEAFRQGAFCGMKYNGNFVEDTFVLRHIKAQQVLLEEARELIKSFEGGKND